LFKVLVADTDTNDKYNSNHYNLISTDNRFEIFNTNTGIDTLNKYYDTNPDAFILSSSFSDLTSFDILRKLSIDMKEQENCNTIFIANECESKLITDVRKIYKILYRPYDSIELFNTICKMYEEKKYPTIDVSLKFSTLISFLPTFFVYFGTSNQLE